MYARHVRRRITAEYSGEKGQFEVTILQSTQTDHYAGDSLIFVPLKMIRAGITEKASPKNRLVTR